VYQLIVEVVCQILIDGRHENDVRLRKLETNVEQNTLGQVGIGFVQEVAQTRGHGSQKTLDNQVIDKILFERFKYLIRYYNIGKTVKM
jgi:hypothetical protein